MRRYEVWFEIYGKKLKTTVAAANEEMAKEDIKNRIIFHKVEVKKNDEFNDIADAMDSFIDILNNAKKK